jgi:ApaG protein
MSFIYSKTTNQITVSVTPKYDEELSIPDDEQYVWEYEVNIKNNGSDVVQLMRRHWVVVGINGVMHEVAGDGVVGVQPILKPGEYFAYASNVQMNSGSGVMIGTYEMIKSGGEIMSVNVPTFSLDSPHIKRSFN